MSAGYGYVKIQFSNEKGFADKEITKKAFEYCCKNFDFFNSSDDEEWEDYGDAFDFDESTGEIFTCNKGDGLDIKRTCPEATGDYWIQDVYNKFKPYQMKVEFYEDFSESSFDLNTIIRYVVIQGRKGARQLFRCNYFDFTNGFQFSNLESNHLLREDEDFYLINDEFDSCHLMAKNKKTNRVIDICDCIEVESKINEDEDEYEEEVVFYLGLKDENGNQVAVGNEEQIASWDCFDSAIEEGDIVLESGESKSQAEWDFYIDVPEEDKFFKKLNK